MGPESPLKFHYIAVCTYFLYINRKVLCANIDMYYFVHNCVRLLHNYVQNSTQVCVRTVDCMLMYKEVHEPGLCSGRRQHVLCVASPKDTSEHGKNTLKFASPLIQEAVKLSCPCSSSTYWCSTAINSGRKNEIIKPIRLTI